MILSLSNGVEPFTKHESPAAISVIAVNRSHAARRVVSRHCKDGPNCRTGPPQDAEELVRLEGIGKTDPEAIPPLPADPVSAPGDLWVLGRHRLLCGDSTKREDLERLMAGERAALFATDPPYLVDYTGMNHPSKYGHAKASKNKDSRELSGPKDDVPKIFWVPVLTTAIFPSWALWM